MFVLIQNAESGTGASSGKQGDLYYPGRRIPGSMAVDRS